MSLANCLINEAFALGCKEGIGGVKRVLLTNWSTFTGTTQDVDQIVTGITSSTWYEFQQTSQTASFSDNVETDLTTGVVVYNQELVLVFNKYDYKLRNTVKLMGQGFLTAIVEDQNGNYRLAGWKNPLELSASEFGTGTSNLERNGASLTLVAPQIEPAFVVDDSVIATLTIVTA